MSQFARLKPFNEKKGFKTRVYLYEGNRYLVENGWYEVSDAVADKLKELHQDHYDEESPYLFDVGSEDDITKIEEKEAKALADARTASRQPSKFAGGRQRTQALPVNNAGGLAGLPGDFTSEDLNTPINGNAPVGGPGAPSEPDSDDERRAAEIGRVGQPKNRSKK